MHTRTSILPNSVTVFAAVAALLLVVAMVSRTSSAAFTASDTNEGNYLNAADITVTADSGSNVLFEVDGMVPGDVEVRCLQVTYDDTTATDPNGADADLALYAPTSNTDDLAQYIDLDIERVGTGTYNPSTDGTDCTNAGTVQDTDHDDTLADLLTNHASYANGVGSHTVNDGDTQVYRFTAELQDDNAAQGLTADGITFTWEAQTN